VESLEDPSAASGGEEGDAEADVDRECSRDEADDLEDPPKPLVQDALNGRAAGMRRATKVMATLHGLQQACNHPAALSEARWPRGLDRREEDFGPEPKNGAKVVRLLELLEELLEAGEKALVFTQYLGTLELLEAAIKEARPEVDVLKLTGGLARELRDLVVQRFQSEANCRVLLCTLGAGGVGLNLTAAAHVVHFDRCWNPAREAQATDRAHRLGQRRSVMVHRLVARNTLEERIASVLERKAVLANEVVPAEAVASLVSECSLEELRELLALCEPPAQGAPSSPERS